MWPLSKRGHVRALHNNDEARMTSDERMTKSEARSVRSTIFRHSIIRHSFVIRHSSFVICLLAFVAGIGTAFAEKRPITEKDLFDFVWIGDPQISPDGSRIGFVRVSVNEKKLGYDTAIWTVSTADKEPPHRLTNGPHDGSPQLSPDGKFLVL